MTKSTSNGVHNGSFHTFCKPASRRSSFLHFLLSPRLAAKAQDWVRTGTNLGAQKIRLAAADFKMVGNDPALSNAQQTFNQVLYSDLTNAGIFDMVSKSMAPPVMPGSPQEINLSQWSDPPANAAMVAFGAISIAEWPRCRLRLAVRREEYAIAAGAGPAI